MRTKKYIEFINEISTDLLKRASDKAISHGQKRLSNKFLSHKSGDKKHINTQSDMKMISSYEFDYFMKYYNLEGDDIEFGDSGGVVKAHITDFDQIDDNEFWIFLGYDDIYIEDDSHLLSKIGLYVEDSGQLHIEFDYLENKFANKKSAIKFIQLLNKLYILHNPNIVNRAFAKINNTEVEELEGTGFYLFVNSNYGSWEEFRKQINIRKLYDTYK